MNGLFKLSDKTYTLGSSRGGADGSGIFPPVPVAAAKCVAEVAAVDIHDCLSVLAELLSFEYA